MGLTLYTLYASTLSMKIPSEIDIHGYADDHAVKKTFQPTHPGNEDLVLLQLSNTMMHIDSWMRENRLKMNPTKTEFVYFGSKIQLNKCVQTSMMVAGSEVQHSSTTKYLGVLLDQHLSFKQQITKAAELLH